MNASEAVLRELVELGVEACFGNPGTSEMHLVASFDRVGGLRPILGLFEGVCTGAADGYARMAGKPAATLLHLGPGLGNGLANIHNAKRGQSRMINLVGDHATYHRKYDAPLQSDIHSIAKPVSDWIGDPVSGPDAIAKAREAFDIAMRPNGGLSTLIVPADIAWSPVEGAVPPRKPRPSAKPVDMALVREAAKALTAGEPAMLLSHHPDFFFEAAAADVDLTLAGHTHGGQIVFAGMAPLRQSQFGYEEGWFVEGNARLYVGRGVGVTVLPLRLGARPEIPMITLVASPTSPLRAFEQVDRAGRHFAGAGRPAVP